MKHYTAFDELHFRRQVDKALETVKKILDVNRTPSYAADVQEHTYDDKYALAEFLTNTAIAAQMNVLERMGLDEEKLRALGDMVHQDKRSVTLRFQAEDTCTFLHEEDVDVTTGRHEHTLEATKETPGMFGGSRTKKETIKSKVTTKIREYHWKVGIEYRLFCFAGNDPDKDPIELQMRNGSIVIITTGNKKAPIPERTVHLPLDVPLTWMMQQVTFHEKKQNICSFKISRAEEKCRTPLRNKDIEAALEFFQAFKSWSEAGAQHFQGRVEHFILGQHKPADGGDPSSTTQHLAALNATGVFCPVLPLMETPRELAGTASRQEHPKSLLVVSSPTQDQTSSPLLSLGDIDKFLNEQIRGMNGASDKINKSFPSKESAKLVTVAEATLFILWKHASSLAERYEYSVSYIEDMLRKQLIAAIGKEVKPKDFDQFMQFHMNKLFVPAYAPKAFVHSIRRPNHYPDGVISIEKAEYDDEPAHTLVRTIVGETAPPMYFPINAATSVEFTGLRYLHGWIKHRFLSAGTSSRTRATLTARARQFSSFLLMVGTIAGASQFNPKDAIILQNKDEVIIPLLLNELPTAKEFKDAIASLSPEQQRFARSFRGMQLESSVFGVCVVQLKPQLETLLGLPQDALTKEIQMTQDLLSLFIDYQIPSDLLSYDGPAEASLSDKVSRVKGYVKAVQDVIENAKKAQLEEASRVADMNIERQFAAFGAGGDEEESGETMQMLRGPPSARGGGEVGRRGRGIGTMIDLSSGSSSGMKSVRRCAPPMARREMAEMAAPPPTAMVDATGFAPAPEARSEPTTPSIKPQDVTFVDVGKELQAEGVDFTMIPKRLDVMFEQHDKDSALRSTIVETKLPWVRSRQENLLTKAARKSLTQSDVKSERNKAFDLLDALSRSGSLPISCAELHVIVAVTHCFENDVMGTVIQDNVNPIEKVEKTFLMMASTIHDTTAPELMQDAEQIARLTNSFPALFETSAEVHDG